MILITGSTGLVGRHLLLALTQQGNEVRALYRSENKKLEVISFFAFATSPVPNGTGGREANSNTIDWQKGDLTNLPRLNEIFKGVTQVYHCAGLISFNPYDFEKLTKINIEGTANVVNICLSNGIKKLVHLSSIATLAKLPNTPIIEENHWDPDANNSVYALTKYGAEMEVWRGTEEGLDAVIFNPGIILGEGEYSSGSGSIFKHVLHQKSYYPQGNAAIIDVKDLVKLLLAGMNSHQKQERYIALGHQMSYKELFEKIAAVLIKKAPYRPLKNWQGNFIVFGDTLRGLFTRKRTITSTGLKSLQQHKKYSFQKAQITFNYTPTSIDQTLERIANHIKLSLKKS